MGEVVGSDVTGDVVNGNERLAAGHSESLCEADSYEQSSDETGSVSYSNAVEVGEGNSGFVE